jgi:hypothetical protein
MRIHAAHRLGLGGDLRRSCAAERRSTDGQRADRELSEYATHARWADDDCDTIWTVTIDAVGNLTVNNALCEGINSAPLPATAPQF